MAIQDTSRPEAPSTMGPRSVSRRDILKGMAVVAGAAALPTILAACGTSTATTAPGGGGGGGGAVTGTVTVGSNHSDPGEAKGMAAVNAAFIAANPGAKVTMNTVDHGTFQNQISAYLQGTPEDDFTWFSGYRMRFFASKGLATPIDDVWAAVKSNFTAGFATSVTGDDGKVYDLDRIMFLRNYLRQLQRAVAEGVPTTKSAYECARGLQVETPIIDEVYALLYQGKSPMQSLEDLMQRDQKSEKY